MTTPSFHVQTIDEPLDNNERQILGMIEARYRAYQEDVAPLVKQLAALRAGKPVRYALIVEGPNAWELTR